MGRIKSLDEIKAEVRAMAGKSKIFRHARPPDVESVLATLTSKDPDLWAAEWSRVAQPYEEACKAHEQARKINQAREAYIQAYTYYAAGRYPVPHSSGKMQSFRKSLELYENAGRYFDPPLKRIEIRYGDKIIPAYLRLRHDGKKHPVIINVGGIDGFKAEAFEYEEAMHRGGLSTCALDMPGVGESPIKASTDSEALFSAVIDYLSMSPEVDAQRIGMLGRSLAAIGPPRWHLPKRSDCAPRWYGAAVCITSFRRLAASLHQRGKLSDGPRCGSLRRLRRRHHRQTGQSISLDVIERSGLARQALLPMLLVNRKDDVQTPIADLYILLEYGSPKSAPVFQAGTWVRLHKPCRP